MSLIGRLLESLKTKAIDEEPERTITDFARPFQFQLEEIRILAEQEGKKEDEMVMELLQSGLERKHATNLSARLLSELTNREVEVAALICCGLSASEIASRLYITPSTARTHISRVLVKLRVKHPAQVRELLSWWDFSEWVD